MLSLSPLLSHSFLFFSVWLHWCRKSGWSGSQPFWKLFRRILGPKRKRRKKTLNPNVGPSLLSEPPSCFLIHFLLLFLAFPSPAVAVVSRASPSASKSAYASHSLAPSVSAAMQAKVALGLAPPMPGISSAAGDELDILEREMNMQTRRQIARLTKVIEKARKVEEKLPKLETRLRVCPSLLLSSTHRTHVWTALHAPSFSSLPVPGSVFVTSRLFCFPLLSLFPLCYLYGIVPLHLCLLFSRHHNHNHQTLHSQLNAGQEDMARFSAEKGE